LTSELNTAGSKLTIHVSMSRPVRRDSTDNYCDMYNDSLRAGRSGDGIPVEARFSAPVHTGLGAHPAFYTIGNRSLSRG